MESKTERLLWLWQTLWETLRFDEFHTSFKRRSYIHIYESFSYMECIFAFILDINVLVCMCVWVYRSYVYAIAQMPNNVSHDNQRWAHRKHVQQNEHSTTLKKNSTRVKPRIKNKSLSQIYYYIIYRGIFI